METMTQQKSCKGLGKMTEKTYAAGSAFPAYTKDTLRLYNMRFCPFTERTRLVLAHKNIPYETVNVNLKQKPDWFLERSPNGLVPVLQLNDQLVYESDICDDYLDDKYPEKRLTPKDPYIKARHRLLRENFSKWTPHFYKVARAEGSELKEILQGMHKQMDHLEQALTQAGTKFFGGEDPGMLDYHIWPWFERFDITENIKSANLLPTERFPSMNQWMTDMWKTDAVKAVSFDTKTHEAFVTSSLKGTPNYDIGL